VDKILNWFKKSGNDHFWIDLKEGEKLLIHDSKLYMLHRKKYFSWLGDIWSPIG